MVKLVGLRQRLNISKCFVSSVFLLEALSFAWAHIHLWHCRPVSLSVCEFHGQRLLCWTPFVVMDATWVLSACVLCLRNAQLSMCAPAKEVFMATLRTVCSAHVNKMQLR